MDNSFWSVIPNAVALVGDVADNILERRSLLLGPVSAIPWPSEFRSRVLDNVRQRDSVDAVREFSGAITDPGEYLLRHYCPAAKQDLYRPSISYARFLAETRDIPLNTMVLWVVCQEEEASRKWTAFINEYVRCVPHGRTPAVFILESPFVDSLNRSARPFKRYNMKGRLAAYDTFAYCTYRATTSSVPDRLKPYLASLISELCSPSIGSIEMCEQLYRDAEHVIHDPEDAVASINAGLSEPGQSSLPTANGLRRAVNKAQRAFLTGPMEDYRDRFIEAHHEAISSLLPLRNAMSEEINDPYLCEFGLLKYLVDNAKLSVTDKEYAALHLLRETRNRLSHLGTLSYIDLNSVLDTCRLYYAGER